jgi:polyvinyl alcohol dehydrogenase (cytochrome)
LRAYSTATGSIIWDIDTVQTYDTANGVPGRGGSCERWWPAISDGTVIINSGYVQNGMPGNVLLAYTVDGK